MTEYVLLVQADGGDYYLGEEAALYIDGQLSWSGASGDQAEDILRAVLGDRLAVRRVKSEWNRETQSRWSARIDGGEGRG